MVSVNHSWWMRVLCEMGHAQYVQYESWWSRFTNWDWIFLIWKINWVECYIDEFMEIQKTYKNVQMTTFQKCWWDVRKPYHKFNNNGLTLCFKVHLCSKGNESSKMPMFFWEVVTIFMAFIAWWWMNSWWCWSANQIAFTTNAFLLIF